MALVGALAAPLLLLLLRGVASAPCGDAVFQNYCCDTRNGPRGAERCWDDEVSFERCCPDEQPLEVSAEVESLAIDPKSIPRLQLLDGNSMPQSGLGLCCRPTAKGEAVRQAVLDYLMMGGRHLDTAQIYQNHREVGLAIRQAVHAGVRRSQIFLTTKIPPDRFGFEAATDWVPAMLAEIGVAYVDLVLLHWAGSPTDGACREPKTCRQETWMALQRFRHSGHIRSLGVSNFGPRQMRELQALGGAPIAVNQLEYHPWIPAGHQEAVAYCHSQGIVVTAYGSMGSSKMAGQMMIIDGLKDIGQYHGKTPGQVLLRWAIEKNVSVVPGTSNYKHMAENLNVFDFAFGSQEMDVLDGVPESERMVNFNHFPDQRP